MIVQIKFKDRISIIPLSEDYDDYLKSKHGVILRKVMRSIDNHIPDWINATLLGEYAEKLLVLKRNELYES